MSVFFKQPFLIFKNCMFSPTDLIKIMYKEYSFSFQCDHTLQSFRRDQCNCNCIIFMPNIAPPPRALQFLIYCQSHSFSSGFPAAIFEYPLLKNNAASYSLQHSSIAIRKIPYPVPILLRSASGASRCFLACLPPCFPGSFSPLNF